MADTAARSLVGQQLGVYRIVSHIGAGAMGDVYCARDDRLGREVALKILPHAFSQNHDRLRRFQQEVRAVGMLNHPNVMAVHDVGEHEGSPYLVCELLSGDTLQTRMTGRALPVPKAVEYAIQIAHGLAAAHMKGIVHRDLKPANLFVTREGYVKILDFGLARLCPEHDAAAETKIADAGTQTGVVVGTAGYMAPEQARGIASDQRSDIFSLGVILHEMLSGRPLFRRDTTADTLSAILHEEPPAFTEAAAIPTALDRCIRRCLEKDPSTRLQSASDLAFVLESALPAAGASQASRRERTSARRSKHVIIVALSLAAGIGAGALLGSRVARVRPSEPARVHPLTTEAGLEEFPAMSPDGRSVAFTASRDGRRQIFVRLIAGGTPLAITHDSADHQFPRWSPDASSIVYFSAAGPGDVRGTLWEVPALGGSPRRIADSLSGGADVNPADGRIAFFRLAQDRIQLVTASRDVSVVEVIAQFAAVTYYLCPRWSPDGTRIAFQRGDSIRYDLFVVPATGGEPRQVTHDNNMIGGFTWTADSAALIYSSGSGDTMPYLPTMRLQQLRLGDGNLRQLTTGEASYLNPDIVKGGAVLASRMRLESDIWKFPVDGSPADNTRRAARLTHQTAHLLTPSAGPGDKEVVFLSDSGGHANLWAIDTENGESRQITRESDPKVAVGVPVWSPDGRSIAFVYSRGNVGLTFGVWLVNPDGSNLRQVANPGLGPAWTPDGRWLYYSTRAGSTGADVVMKKIPADGGLAVTVTTEKLRNVIGSDGSTVYYLFERPLVDGRPEFEIRAAHPENAPFRVLARIPAARVPIWQIVNPALSPDGKWLAQALTDGMTTNIWALSTSTGDWRQVTDFGERATFIARRVSWSSDGRSILAAVGEGDSDIVLLEGLLPSR